MANTKKVHDPLDRCAALTVTEFPATKNLGPRIRIKCGCCWQHFAIFTEVGDDSAEIAGVLATKDQWRKIFNEILK